MKRSDRQLIREYVRAVLKEDDGYGGLMGVAAEMSPFGMHYASKSDLYNTFIKPFTDVIDVAKGSTKEMSVRAATALKVAFEAVAGTLLPTHNTDFEKIFDHQREQLDKVKEEYREVYDASWDALKQNDIVWASFLAYPSAFLTAAVAKKTPGFVMNVMSVLSGGELDPLFLKLKKNKNKEKSIDHIMGAYHKHSTWSEKSSDEKYGSGDKIGGFVESLIREDDKKTKRMTIADALTDDLVMKKALESPYARRMQTDAQKVLKQGLAQVYERTAAIAGAKTLEDLQKIHGSPFKGMDQLSKVDKNERERISSELVNMVKKSTKELALKQLEGQVKDAIEAGVPQNSGFIEDYKKVIEKIKAL